MPWMSRCCSHSQFMIFFHTIGRPGPLSVVTGVIVIPASDLRVLHELAHAEAALDTHELGTYNGDTLAGLFLVAHLG